VDLRIPLRAPNPLPTSQFLFLVFAKKKEAETTPCFSYLHSAMSSPSWSANITRLLRDARGIIFRRIGG
jgi:hypothetical protein